MLEEEKIKILELFNPKDKVILDVGCGDGRYSTILSETCKKYIGIDIDDEENIKRLLSNEEGINDNDDLEELNDNDKNKNINKNQINHNIL